MEITNETIQKPNNRIFGTKEWAKHSLNIRKGCKNDCKYCYAKGIGIHYKRHTVDDWKIEVLNEKVFYKKTEKKSGRIMFPTAHDITPDNLRYFIIKLREILEAGNEVLIVSKPHLSCIISLCDEFFEYKEKITFRFTIGSLDSVILKFWEPSAPSFEERLLALNYAFNNGYKTSISCEPMLDNNAVQLVEKLLPFVNDSIWLGKANRLKVNLSINGYKDQLTLERADELMAMHNDEYIFALYEKFKDNSMIKWKDSIKKVIGLSLAETSGLDI